jgi:alpha-beta hydrolase superfamily lysophospholipase
LPSCAAVNRTQKGGDSESPPFFPSMEFRVHATDTYTCYSPAIPLFDNPPIVIHVPGFNGDALTDAPFALRLARLGWHCYTLEPPWSATPDLQNPTPQILFTLFDRLEPALNELVASFPRTAWVALTGFSMGGMFVSRMLVREKSHPFAAAAMILSSGDWSFLPRTAVNAIAELRAAIDESALHQIEAYMRQISPVAHADRFPPTPLFLLNATHDPRVPADNARAFYESLLPAYRAAAMEDRLEWQLLPGNRHEFRRHLQQAVRDWLHVQHGS